MNLIGRATAVLLLSAAMTLTGVLPAAAVEASPTPSPTASCSARPNFLGFDVTPQQAAPGDPVQLEGQYTEACPSNPPAEHSFTLFQRTADAPYEAVQTVRADGTGRFVFAQERPQATTTYTIGMSRDPVNGPYDYLAKTVTVGRTLGSCAGAVSLTAPATVPVGGFVRVAGTAPGVETVNVLFRKRGQTVFQVRRTLTPAADGAFSTTFRADDDYRLYAASARCDSPPALVLATPTISGPATAARNSTVTLSVRGAAGQPVKVYFRRAGTTAFVLGRIGTVAANGTYTTTYRATADYRYYAATGPEARRSNWGLTQLR